MCSGKGPSGRRLRPAIRARPVDAPASARHRRPAQSLRRRSPRMVVEDVVKRTRYSGLFRKQNKTDFSPLNAWDYGKVRFYAT